MRWNISARSIQSPLPAVVMFVILVIMGSISFNQMSITSLPNVDIPVVVISIQQYGSTPKALEAQVTKLVEDSVASIRDVWHINSSITADGVSSTIIQFRAGAIRGIDALNAVKDNITALRPKLPEDIEEPIISKLNVEEIPILVYAVSSQLRLKEELSWFVKNKVAGELRTIDGVGDVNFSGAVDKEIRVSLEPHKLLAYGLTAADVNSQIYMSSLDASGGMAETSDRMLPIRILAPGRTTETLASLPIRLPGGGHIPLDVLGQIKEGPEEETSFALINQHPAVIFTISRAKGASEVSVAEAVTKKIEKLRGEYPDMEFKQIDSKVSDTLSAYKATMTTLIEGAILTVLVVFLFLRDLRTTFIAALALPLSIIPTFWIMDLLGFSLNRLSLLAITLVTGILVDDAIVEVENIIRHMRTGKSAYRASMEAADEIGLAVIAISLTIIAIFMPVAFMSGMSGQFFRQFGLTVSISVFVSLLVARLITPVLCAYFASSKAANSNIKLHGNYSKLLDSYTQLVSYSLKHRWWTVVIGVVFLVASVVANMLLPGTFVPDADDGRASLAIKLPPGSKLSEVKHVAHQITPLILDMPEVDSVLAYSGGGTPFGLLGITDQTTMLVSFVDKKKRRLSERDLVAQISDKLYAYPDIEFAFKSRDGHGRDIIINISGYDMDLVRDTANSLLKDMEKLPTIVAPEVSTEFGYGELRLIPKQPLATKMGISPLALAEAMRVATVGDRKLVAKVKSGDRLIPVRVRIRERERGDMDVLQNINVGLPGAPVRFPSTVLADFEMGQGYTAIRRHDRKPHIAITANLDGGASLGEAYADILNSPTAKNLPTGVEFHHTGDVEAMQEINEAFMHAMIIGLMIVYAVLSLLFHSLTHPATILLSLPFAAGGAAIALFITNHAISLPVVIGILMLLGIVTKNAILMVDYAIEEMMQGASNVTAMVEAGRKRARPIVMTTCAMIAGMLPAALSFGAGAEFRAPMAIAVIGGLIVSTLLSLLFVPALFTVLDDFSSRVFRFFSPWINEAEEDSLPQEEVINPD